MGKNKLWKRIRWNMIIQHFYKKKCTAWRHLLVLTARIPYTDFCIQIAQYLNCNISLSFSTELPSSAQANQSICARTRFSKSLNTIYQILIALRLTTELYLGFQPHYRPVRLMLSVLWRNWMIKVRLMINDDKTGFLLIWTKQLHVGLLSLIEILIQTRALEISVNLRFNFRCSSYVGCVGGKQPINLGYGCWGKGTIAHEIGRQSG